MGKEKKVLIVAIGGMGDLLRGFPLLVSLRKMAPHWRPYLLTNYPLFGELLALLSPTFRPVKVLFWDLRRRPSLLEKLKILLKVRKERFDVLLDTSRGTGWRGNYRLGCLSGIPLKVGFVSGKLGRRYEIRIPFSPSEPLVHQNLSLLKVLGFSVCLDFGLRHDLPPRRIAPLVCHSGAVDPGRNPPRKFWEALLQKISSKVVAIGSREESPFWEGIPGVFNFCGRLSLSELAGVLKGCQLFIGVDSGPLHLAVALGVPSIGLFGPTSPEQVVGFYPHFKAIRSPFPCAPCYLHQPGEHIKCDEAPCTQALSPEKVLEISRHFVISASKDVIISSLVREDQK